MYFGRQMILSEVAQAYIIQSVHKAEEEKPH